MKRAIAVLLCTLILISLMPMSAFAEEPTLITYIAPEPLYSNAPATSELEAFIDTKAFIEHFKNAVKSHPTVIDVSKFNIPPNATKLIASLIYYETPELFSIYGLSFSQYSDGTKIIGIYPQYRFTAQEYQEALVKMEQMGNKLLKGVKGNDNLTEAEKALILHDRLAVWAEYDINYKSATTPASKIIYTAYGVLVNRTGV